MIPYIEFPFKNTYIASESAEYTKVTVIQEHAHSFLELVLVSKGACIHCFRNIEMPLFAGDVFIIPPDQPHSYRLTARTKFFNCYFYPDHLGTHWFQMIYDALQNWNFTPKIPHLDRQTELLSNLNSKSDQPNAVTAQTKAAIQGVIHLTPSAANYVESLLLQIENEQQNQEFASESMKLCALLSILITINRTRSQQVSCSPEYIARSASHTELIHNALLYIDQHYSDEIDLKKLAHDSSLSESYFRTIFKNVTGMPPLEYITRLRIIKALKLIQRDGMTIRQAAECVGIYDPNYFTRLFKKIMGHSPKYFKKI